MATGKKKRRMSPAKRRMYRRRRIVAGIALVVVLCLCGALIWGVGKGVTSFYTWLHRADINAVSRSAVPTARKTSGVPNCSSSDVTLSLSSSAATLPVGGSIDFTATVTYTGSNQCLINVSSANRVLTVTSSDQTVYHSDVCPANARMLLLGRAAELKENSQKITWGANSNASDTECRQDSELPKVARGTYVARLSLKNAPDVRSEPVTIEVQ
ncbi:hypothetical protein G1C96_1094 [Bifidobacterium sp. DSM 109958]|uniref:Peptide ABC transporter permease n=2 Tax=Bifidobacterium moraviense TaxID=2675323 RepID=A0A7Y0F1W4_9BIFI|nr:hypothetical protein [Bifidobacterium sp. DSM 109958]